MVKLRKQGWYVHCGSSCDEYLSIRVAPWVESVGIIGVWGYWCNMSLALWFVGVKSRDSGRRRRWRSCGFIPMDQKRRRMSTKYLPSDWRSKITSYAGLGFRVYVVEPQDRPAWQFMDFAGFGPQNPAAQFWRESNTTRGVIGKDASRWSNFMKTTCPSDQNSKSWSSSSLVEWIGYMYLGVV